MATGVTGSVTVGFGTEGSLKRLVLESDSSSHDEEGPGESFIRVFPSYAAPKLHAVHGSIALLGRFIPENVEDYVSFSGGSSSELQYPPTGLVKIWWGEFYKAEPSVTYDEATASLVLSEEAYGIVKVTYTAFFDRYSVRHGDAPCKIYIASDDDDGTVPNYEPAFVVATSVGYEIASMQVSGPSCSHGTDTSNYVQNVEKGDYTSVGLKMEVDFNRQPNMYSIYFNANDTPDGFTLNAPVVTVGGKSITRYCGCRVRIYPKVAGIRFEGVNCAVSSQHVDEGTLDVYEALTFTGQQSVNLSYPPSTKVTLSRDIRDAATNFGNFVSVTLAGPGDRVNEVEWESSTRYKRVQSRRMVRPDEVVTVTKGNITVPCYTWASARYQSDYYLYDVLFNWDDTSGWYQSAMVLCIDADGTLGYLQLEPPAKGGIL